MEELADAVTLLCFGADGRGPRSAVPGAEGIPIAGALLVDLLRAGELRLDGRRLVPRERAGGDRPPGAGLSDPAGAVLGELRASSRPRPAEHWVTRLASKAKRAQLQRLAEGGVIAERRRRLLGVIPLRRYVVASEQERSATVTRVDDALSGRRPPDRDTATIVALALAGRLLGNAFERRGRRKRLRHARERAQEWTMLVGPDAAEIVEAVRRAVRSQESAATTPAVTTGS